MDECVKKKDGVIEKLQEHPDDRVVEMINGVEAIYTLYHDFIWSLAEREWSAISWVRKNRFRKVSMYQLQQWW